MSTNNIPQYRPAVNPLSRNSTTSIHVDGRKVGYVCEDTFHKSVCGSKHMLRSPRGWASDVAALHAARRAGAAYIEIHDTETDATYRAGISTMLDRGVRINRGFGDQVVLTLENWQRPDLGDQLSLFAMEPVR